MLKPEEVNVAEKLAKHIADVADTDELKDEHDVSCKISFIMSLLVSAKVKQMIFCILSVCTIQKFMFSFVG